MKVLSQLSQIIISINESEETDNNFRFKLKGVKDDYPEFRHFWFSKEKGIQALYGIDSAGEKREIVTLLFRKEKWNQKDAEQWLKDHDYTFEPMT